MRRLLARNFFASRRTNEKRVESTEGSSVDRAHCIAAINRCVRQPERWQTTRQPSKASEAGVPCSDDLPTGNASASVGVCQLARLRPLRPLNIRAAHEK